jgi:hypothetical protein
MGTRHAEAWAFGALALRPSLTPHPRHPLRSDSILGVSIFSEEAPTEFGRFDQAFVSMFQITAGETSFEVTPPRTWSAERL